MEENIYNYKISNITQPTDFVIENSVIDKEHDQNKISASIIASGERNDNCMTQSSAKPQMKMLKIVKNPLLKRMKIL